MIKRQKDRKFELVSKFKPAGDQEQAIDKLSGVAEADEIARDSIANLGVVLLDLKG